jgi:hypothetical protein
MKLAVRIFAMSIVVVGLAAASVSSATSNTRPSHQALTSTGPSNDSLPIPQCGPYVPCPSYPVSGK